MANGYKVLQLTGSHLQAAADLYNLLINYNGKKNFTTGPFPQVDSVIIKTEFKKGDLVRVSGELLTVPFILNLQEASAVLMTEPDVNQLGLFYDIINIYKVDGIDVEIKVIDLKDSIVEEWRNSYVASTDELITKAGECLKDADKIPRPKDKEFYTYLSEDLRHEIYLEDTANKFAQEIIKIVKDLYGGSNYRVCFCSDVHEYLVLMYSDIGVYHYKSIGFNRGEKMYRTLYKNIVRVLKNEGDRPVQVSSVWAPF
ncbi:MAG: hypothetical protein LBV52_04560 [Spirochaetaceae bacterium]|jgi:hypothetical protein|nr:hypothetical protein [Spirochaetaceae bacterium]